ncbi:MAG: hypothetical protein KGL39_02800 [Patescibacteria group bacterium]|nr:hypothetical protein [Patescibacteria group bacterium]
MKTRDQIIAENPLEPYLASIGVKLIGAGNERMCKCPVHEDHTPSCQVNVATNLWRCYGCGQNGSIIDMMALREGVHANVVLKRLGEAPDNWKPPKPKAAVSPNGKTATAPDSKPKLVKTYDYRNAQGELIYQAVRLEPKSFRQRRPVGDGKWMWNMEGVERVLYQLPKLLKSKHPWVYCEGEKDADTVTELGSWIGTTHVGGSKSWLDAYADVMAGRNVILCGDNDEPGREMMKEILQALAGKAKTVTAVKVPEPHKDVTEWLETMPDLEARFAAFKKLVDDSPVFERGLDVPLYTVQQLRQQYIRSVQRSLTHSLDLGRWLPTLGKSVRPLVGGEVLALLAATKVGKCLGKGTPVMLFDGNVIAVEDVKPGQLLMGPDSEPRRVLNVCSGQEMMYRVDQCKGESYSCNESHVLSLQKTNRGGRHRDEGKIVNVSVGEYLNKSRTFKHCYKGWRTGVEFYERPLPLDPYFLGLWLGDGHSHSPAITTADVEIKKFLLNFARKHGLRVRIESGHSGLADAIHLVRRKKRGSKCVVPGCGNKHCAGGFCKDHYMYKRYHDGFSAFKGCGTDLIGLLDLLEVRCNKHVPFVYRSNSRSNRLLLLAGLIDSDGYSGRTGTHFCNSNERLARDVLWLARSLGFKATIARKKTSIKSIGYTGLSWVVSMFGKVSDIPVKLKRKLGHDSICRSSQRCGISVSKIGFGDYHGFTIDGDGLFLLGDFTVTHNTACAQNLVRHAAPLKTVFFEQELPGSLMLERYTAISNSTPAADVFQRYQSGDRSLDEMTDASFAHVLTCTRSHLSVPEMEALIVKSELLFGEPPALAVVDHVQLCGGGGERYARVSDAMEALNSLAVNRGIIIVVLSQIGRKDSDQPETEPVNLTDGKESGAIENSSRVVLGAWRPDHVTLVIKVLANTKGLPGKEITCNFDGERLLVTERSPVAEEEAENGIEVIEVPSAPKSKPADESHLPYKDA